MVFSKFDTAIRKAEGYIRAAERYLKVSGKYGPSSVGANFEYFNALKKLNEAGILAKNLVQQERYQRGIERLGYIARRTVDTAVSESKRLGNEVRSSIDWLDSLRPMKREEENFPGHANMYNNSLKRVKSPSLKTAYMMLSRAGTLLEDVRNVAESYESVDLYRLISEQKARLTKLKNELEKR